LLRANIQCFAYSDSYCRTCKCTFNWNQSKQPEQTKKLFFEDFLSRKKTELGGLKNTSYNKLIGDGGPYLKFDQAYLSKQCAARTPLIISPKIRYTDSLERCLKNSLTGRIGFLLCIWLNPIESWYCIHNHSFSS